MVGFILKFTLKRAVENPFLCSRNNMIIEVNDSILKLSGYSKNELLGKSLTDISSILRIDSQVNLENIDYKYSCYMFTKELEPREVTIWYKSLKGKNEKEYFIKEKPNSRIENRLPYASGLLKDNEIGMAIYSITNEILIKANNKFLDFLGIPDRKREDNIGRTPKEIFNGYNESNFQWIFNDVIKFGKPYYLKKNKYEYIEKGDTNWCISLVPIYLSGQAKYVVYTAYEIAKECLNYSHDKILESNGNFIKEENLLIKTQLDFIKNMIENLEVGFVRYFYPGLEIIDINNKAYSDLKIINPNVGTISSLIGGNIFSLFNFNNDEKAKFTMNLQNIINKKVNSNFDYKKIVVKGEERLIKLIHQPLFGLNNKITEMVDVAIDVTEEVKVKNQMEKTFKIQEELFANVSHELKTPLNVIFSTDQLLELYLKNDSLEVNRDKISKSINVIKQNCYRFAKLINNIVDLHKIESGFYKLNLSNENIVQVTEDIVQSASIYIKRKGLSIIFDTNTEEKIIACDAGNIERIILNLISNAIKFSNPGGSIFVNVFDKGDTVEITVEDTGIGIEKKHLNKIFGTFQQVDKSFSRNTEGSGIGLALVKSIAELHGGKISVDSEVGKGSIFRIDLPGRIVENSKVIENTNPIGSKIQKVKVEFSDIY
ncbi:MAG: histidine kinase [Clostridiaceae bacterium]|jgi:signal transduction histidine kinase|nr:histidine kinase [Clostridiaceae bacterium]